MENHHTHRPSRVIEGLPQCEDNAGKVSIQQKVYIAIGLGIAAWLAVGGVVFVLI